MKNRHAANTGVRIGMIVIASLAFAATACSRYVSRGVSPDGQAAEVVFPAADSAVFAQGTFPNIDNLRSIGAGVTKDQLHDLLGRPHFREGFKAREWDYLFNFRQDGGSVRTCQYKVIFDAQYRGQGFHWAPAECASLLERTPDGAAPVARVTKTLSMDALFRFALYGLGDILPSGREELAALAAQIKAIAGARVSVVGHTDRIGSDADNLLLSQRRAETVRDYLIERGVMADGIDAVGRGEAEPVKQCEEQPRQALIDCLAPNRRAEISASAG